MTTECSPWSPAEGEKKRRLEAERERETHSEGETQEGGGVWVRNKTERYNCDVRQVCLPPFCPRSAYAVGALQGIYQMQPSLCSSHETAA